MRSTLFAWLALLILPLSACNLYFSGNPDPDPCDDYADWGGGAGDRAQPPLLRNPATGTCETFGWTQPPYPCDGVCGPCPEWDGNSGDGTAPGSSTTPTPPPGDPSDEDSEGAAEAPQEPTPTWGYCDSYCTGLDEQSCLAITGCRGIYDGDANGSANEFLECWQTDFSGPPLVENCEGLDATTCSQLDSCIAVHQLDCNDTDGNESDGLIEPPCQPSYFVACHNEGEAQGCYGDQDCADGSSCNAAEVCLPPPGNGSPCPPDGNGGCDVPAVCYGYCVPDSDPGECDGDVFCDGLPPQCEAGTTPGIANGCWTGQCIDLSTCPQASCSDIVGESMCVARSDCSPYYVGVDCTCTADSCDCAEWNFESCGSGAPDTP